MSTENLGPFGTRVQVPDSYFQVPDSYFQVPEARSVFQMPHRKLFFEVLMNSAQ